MAIDLTGTNLRSIQRGFRSDFESAFAKTVPLWSPMLATEVPSSASENVYAWMNQIPKMREWVGPRVLNSLATSEYTLKNKAYENSLIVPMDSVEDDTFGVYRPIAQEIGRQAALWPDDLVADALLNGTTRLCYDGQAFFSASHPIDPADPASATYSNYYSSGKALQADAVNFTAVRAAMLAIKGVDGRPLGVMPNLLVVPPSLEIIAKTIVSATLTTNGGTNVLQSLASVLVIPELEVNPTEWYLCDTTRGIKPFVFQKRRAPRFTPRTSVTDDNVAYLRELHFLADARGAAGYALPFLAVKAKALCLASRSGRSPTAVIACSACHISSVLSSKRSRSPTGSLRRSQRSRRSSSSSAFSARPSLAAKTQPTLSPQSSRRASASNQRDHTATARDLHGEREWCVRCDRRLPRHAWEPIGHSV